MYSVSRCEGDSFFSLLTGVPEEHDVAEVPVHVEIWPSSSALMLECVFCPRSCPSTF